MENEVDPELVSEFCDESMEFLNELQSILEEMEENELTSQGFEDFGQIIDRIMGTARFINQDEIATFCELGKVIGYKSSQCDNLTLLEISVAILLDSVSLLKIMIENIRSNNQKKFKDISNEKFVTRLQWLSDKFKDIDRASCSHEVQENKKMDQSAIDDLMASLGM